MGSKCRVVAPAQRRIAEPVNWSAADARRASQTPIQVFERLRGREDACVAGIDDRE